MVRIGIIGIGFMGNMHFLAARKVRGAKVTAICTRDEKKLKGDWRSIKGNYGPAGTKVDLTGIKTYRDPAALLADPDIDMVDICLPTNLHGEITKQALAAGKHVLLEKPIALDTAEGKLMVSASRKANKLLMIAHVLPFFPEWQFALKTVLGGESGRLQAAHFHRIICKPDWSKEMADDTKTGGPAIDLHIHDTHFVQLLCGAPRQVFSRGIIEQKAVTHLETTYLFDGPAPVVTCSSGALCQKGRPFSHGFELYLERATLLLEGGKLTMLTNDGKSKVPKLGTSDPVEVFSEEIRTAVNAIADNVPAPALSADGALLALNLCHKEIESVKTGRPVKL